MFIDEVQIFVCGGNGGAGSMSFRREAYVPKGGPDGGDGGQGGSVYLQANPSISSLVQYRFKHHFTAQRAGHGKGAKKHGANGDDLILSVPIGTQVYAYDDGSKAKGELLGDLTKSGQQLLVAHGGHGGMGNTHFVTPTHRAPAFAELGEPASGRWIDLEMKLMADVALVGMPSVGKSSLIAKISAAKPKIADYPFTTLVPNLGVVTTSAGDFVVADIPGLIEGASQGKGLGHEFLRHIERSALIVHILDATGDYGQRDPAQDYTIINKELEAHSAQPSANIAETADTNSAGLALELSQKLSTKLSCRQQVVVVNKIDAVTDDVLQNTLATVKEIVDKTRPCTPVFAISAVTGQGMQPLLDTVANKVSQLRQDAAAQAKEADLAAKYDKVWRLDSAISPKKDFAVYKLSKGVYEIEGDSIARMVIQTDMENDEAVLHLQKRLQKAGIDDRLRAQGAVQGDEIRITNRAFEFSG